MEWRLGYSHPMSPKSSIKYENDQAAGQGFHLYEELFDEENIYLELTGFQFEASSSADLTGNGVPRLVVKLPLAWAQKLGIVGPEFPK
jgi:hypothetical protein